MAISTIALQNLLTPFPFPGDRRPFKKDACTRGQMNLLSMASVVAVVEPELKWGPFWLRARWAAGLLVLLASVVLLLLPLTSVEDQCQAVLKGLSLLKNKLGLGYMGITRYTGQTTGLSVTTGGLELLVLKPKVSPGRWAGLHLACFDRRVVKACSCTTR